MKMMRTIFHGLATCLLVIAHSRFSESWSKRGCGINDFICDNKNCVFMPWKCDFHDDCGDGSDERNCAGYDYTTVNSDQLCNDVKLEPIGNLWECKNSAFNLKKINHFNKSSVFSAEEVADKWPKGCYALDDGDSMNIYWNTHSTGDSNTNAHRICRAGDPETRTKIRAKEVLALKQRTKDVEKRLHAEFTAHCEKKDGTAGDGRTQGTCPAGLICQDDALCSADCMDLDFADGFEDGPDFDLVTDAQGHHCTWYEIGDEDCGKFDDVDFKAKDLCCACKGKETFDPLAVGTTSCIDTDDGAKDEAEWPCQEYQRHWCGKYDDQDFDSQTMCCICGGGHTEPVKYL